MRRNEDVFDRFMATRLMRPFESVYRKHREGILYLLFGGLTTLINLACFAFLTILFKMNPLIANVIAFIVGVIFAYITNRKWVFESCANSIEQISIELTFFVAGRVATLLMEEALLWIGIEKLGFNNMLVKIIATILVIVANYIISKFFVFKESNSEQ